MIRSGQAMELGEFQNRVSTNLDNSRTFRLAVRGGEGEGGVVSIFFFRLSLLFSLTHSGRRSI